MNFCEKVDNESCIRNVASLAHEIWNQHFVPIIGQAQVDYMLDKFQSVNAITKQLNEGFEYYIISSDKTKAGYLGLLPDINSGKMMISKIYVRKELRGSGVGNSAIEFVKNLCRNRNINTIWLTVNRYNDDTIEWYLRKGFVIVQEVKKDIGNGFFMDDYIMEMKV